MDTGEAGATAMAAIPNGRPTDRVIGPDAVPASRRQAIARAWLTRALDGYPAPTARFLRDVRDRFRNPVGHALAESFPPLVDELFGSMDPAVITPSLDRIMRIRAVQEANPDRAVTVITVLREALREGFGRGQHADAAALGTAEARVEDLIVQALDLHARCRAQLAEIVARDARRRVHVLERMQARRGAVAR
jgi:RsbT co-antagonist protein rsbRD N-terminal domain